MKFTKLILTIILTSFIFCCSSSDDNETNETNDQNTFTIANDNYEITNAYLKRDDLGGSGFYTILFTNGEIFDFNSNPQLFSNDFEYGIGFVVRVPIEASILPSITFNYDGDENTNNYLSVLSFSNQYVIVNNEVQSYNTVMNQNDVINEEARIIVNELNDGTFNFNFNAITTVGQFNGSYTGEVEIIN